MIKTALCFLFPLLIAATTLTMVRYASADDSGAVTVEPFTPAVGSAEAAGSAVAPAAGSGAVTVNAESGSTVNVTPAATVEQPEQLGILTRLWRNGVIFAFGIVGAYLGLSVWAKVDKKRAFYASQALGGLTLLVDSIPRAATPNATTIAVMLLPMIGILVTGPKLTLKTPEKQA